MRLTIDTSTQATNSSIAEIANNNTAAIPDIFYGDQLQLEVTFTDGAGNFAEFTGRADHGVLFAVGTIPDRNAMTTTGTLNQDGGIYKTTIDLDTQAIEAAIGTKPSVELFIEIQISFADGTTETMCQQSVTLRNQIIK